MSFCANCGEEVKPQDKFCKKCGSKVLDKHTESVLLEEGPEEKTIKAPEVEPNRTEKGKEKVYFLQRRWKMLFFGIILIFFILGAWGMSRASTLSLTPASLGERIGMLLFALWTLYATLSDALLLPWSIREVAFGEDGISLRVKSGQEKRRITQNIRVAETSKKLSISGLTSAGKKVGWSVNRNCLGKEKFEELKGDLRKYVKTEKPVKEFKESKAFRSFLFCFLFSTTLGAILMAVIGLFLPSHELPPGGIVGMGIIGAVVGAIAGIIIGVIVLVVCKVGRYREW